MISCQPTQTTKQNNKQQATSNLQQRHAKFHTKTSSFPPKTNKQTKNKTKQNNRTLALTLRMKQVMMTAASTALVMLVLVLGGSGVSASFSPKVANFTKRTIVNSMNQPNVVGQAVQHLHSQHNKQAKLAQAHTHTRTQAHTHTRTRFSPRSLLNEHAQAHATLYAADAPGYTDPFYIFNVTSADHHGVSVLHPGCLVVHNACSLSRSNTLTHTHTHTHTLSRFVYPFCSILLVPSGWVCLWAAPCQPDDHQLL